MAFFFYIVINTEIRPWNTWMVYQNTDFDTQILSVFKRNERETGLLGFICLI